MDKIIQRLFIFVHFVGWYCVFNILLYIYIKKQKQKQNVMENITLTLTLEEAKVLENLLFNGPQKGKVFCYNQMRKKLSQEIESVDDLGLGWLK